MVAHLIPTLYFFIASAASTVTKSSENINSSLQYDKKCLQLIMKKLRAWRTTLSLFYITYNNLHFHSKICETFLHEITAPWYRTGFSWSNNQISFHPGAIFLVTKIPLNNPGKLQFQILITLYKTPATIFNPPCCCFFSRPSPSRQLHV